MNPPPSTPCIYLDYCATTPVDPRVFDAMVPYFATDFGNPSSRNHVHGRRAADAIQTAREHVSELAGCHPQEVIWTSGATEANNLALKGFRQIGRNDPHRIVTQVTEHPAVLDPSKSLGNSVALRVDRKGMIDIKELESAVKCGQAIVSIMAANNETGVVFPLEEIARVCHRFGSVLHSDASQIFGKLPLPTQEYDMLSVSSHKLYGPKGTGALIVKRRKSDWSIRALHEGGGQERGLRSGTLNVPGIVGFGEACRIANVEMSEEALRIRLYRDRLESVICAAVSEVVINGKGAHRLPNVSNLGFFGVDAESLILGLDEIAISTGSACSSASLEPSHVLRAMSLPNEIQNGSVRISLGRPTTETEVDKAAADIIRAVKRIRELAHAW